MNTNTETRARGIQAVHANIDPKAILTDLSAAFEEFKANQNGRIDNLEKIIARSEFPGGGVPQSGISAAAKEHKKAFIDGFVRKGIESNLRELEVQAALQIGSDPDGGYGVPEEIDAEIERLGTDAVPMRRIARVKQITTSDYKKLVSAGGTSSGWVGETESRSETDTPILKQIAPTIGEIYANPAATQSLLDDFGFDVEEWLNEEVSDEITDQEGTAFITGNGVKKPRGILSYDTSSDDDSSRDWGVLQYVATGGASTFNDYTKLIDLVHSLRAKYRNGAVWLMNSTTLAHVRKFQDGDGNFIWKAGLEQGAPSTLLGYPVEEDENMPDIGAGAYPIAFGNFKRGYLIVDRTGIRVLRDALTNKPYVHFYTTKRLGGACTNFQAIKLLKIAAS